MSRFPVLDGKWHAYSQDEAVSARVLAISRLDIADRAFMAPMFVLFSRP